ncbi:hypothetical protein CGJ89_23670, partial [Vibrio parahaemolyticus]
MFSFYLSNAALRGEQRKPPYLKHCTVNTKAKLRTKIAKRCESLLNSLLSDLYNAKNQKRNDPKNKHY